MSFPTTYVIDRNGKIVGEPVLGGITNENSMKQLQENIDTAIAVIFYDVKTGKLIEVEKATEIGRAK